MSRLELKHLGGTSSTSPTSPCEAKILKMGTRGTRPSDFDSFPQGSAT